MHTGLQRGPIVQTFQLLFCAPYVRTLELVTEAVAFTITPNLTDVWFSQPYVLLEHNISSW